MATAIITFMTHKLIAHNWHWQRQKHLDKLAQSYSSQPSESKPTILTVAVLGSTGNTGSCTVRNLLDHSPQKRVHAYCRNKAKLLRVIPEGADNKRVEVFQGSIEDGPLLDSLLRGTKAVFLAVTSNGAQPNPCQQLRTTRPRDQPSANIP